MKLNALLEHIDAVLVTHIHCDHWDAAAQALLPKQIPILCQPEDQGVIAQAGFSTVLPIQQQRQWQGSSFSEQGAAWERRTRKKTGLVSVFVLKGANAPSLYIAGDTI